MESTNQQQPKDSTLRFLWFLIPLIVCSGAQARLQLSTVSNNGQAVLYIKDGKSGIETGDAQNIKRALSQRSYSQVWLHSGGGNLYEGVKIGLVLREFGSFVRVKKGDYCISACTIAFLGGVLRTVDEDATYQVHAYSKVLSGLRPEQESLAKVSPGKFIREYAQEQFTQDAPFWSASLFLYIRSMIQHPPAPKRIQVFNTYSQNQLTNQIKNTIHMDYERYVLNNLSVDENRGAQEGIAATHDIAMRLEREAMAYSLIYLDSLAKQQQLGKRAKPALRILRTMFESSILATSSLNQSTLREYGYTNVASSK
ncbi:hypothetical protein [Aliiglaciecola lipolytica]|uniref:hypothetical protein n=1 Tax=Aliiglaciecola lipolytica TaxID=477689 RepID=UPI000307B794|nr:hypothetical protein [Aliiglaciecola lipolytica]